MGAGKSFVALPPLEATGKSRPSKQRAPVVVLLLFLLLGLLVQSTCAGQPPPTRVEQIQLRAEEKLGHLCRRSSSIKRMSEMQELIASLRLVIGTKDYNSYRDQVLPPGSGAAQPPASGGVASTLKTTLTNTYNAPFKFFTQDPSTPCLAQADAIDDLDSLLQERDNVCSAKHLDRIEQYFERHLRRYFNFKQEQQERGTGVGSSQQVKQAKPITAKFFSLYANQVSFVCKSNLLHSLHAVDQLVGQEDFDKVMPWLSEEHSDTCQKIEATLNSQLSNLSAEDLSSRESVQELTRETLVSAGKSLAATISSDKIKHCNARKLLSELSNVDELVEVIESSESGVRFTDEAEPSPGDSPVSSGLFLIVPESQKQVVSDMLVTCAKLKPIYEQTVMPIVRLARLGFNPKHSNFDKVCSSDQLIKKWFGLTLVCNSMLSSQLPSDLNKYKELIRDNNMAGKSFVVVDDAEGGQDAEQTLASKLDESLAQANGEALAKLIKNPIEDELWIYKYDTTKLQRIKDGIMKKVFKLFKVEDINSHIVFRRRVSDTSRWIVRIVLITLALVTFDRVVVG